MAAPILEEPSERDVSEMLEYMADPGPFQQGLTFFQVQALTHDWDLVNEFKRQGELTAFKIKVRTSDKNEPTAVRSSRMLVQGLLNLHDWRDVRWVQHAVDPVSGEVLIDEFRMPTQWQRVLGNNYATEIETGYDVVITPSGTRCNCPYAEHAPAPVIETPWGTEPSGGTAPCPHSALAEFIRKHELVPKPEGAQ